MDVPWKYLNFFMEDDKKLAHIGKEYGAGRMLTGTEGVGQMPNDLACVSAKHSCILDDVSYPQCAMFVATTLTHTHTGEVKAELVTLLTDIVARHQKARAQVTDDIVDAFMAVRPMQGALKSRN